MDDISRSIIEEARPSLGARAHQLYLDFIHLGIALMQGRAYTISYRVHSRHLWADDGGESSEGTGATVGEALAACVAAHRRNNRDSDDWQVEWSATLTVTHGSWRRTFIVPPDAYRTLVPGGTFGADIMAMSTRPAKSSA